MEAVATDARKVRTFRGGDLVADLMAELSRVGIAQRIASARKQAGLNQRELADVMGVHWRTVQDWESPRKETTPWDRLDELGAVMDVTKDWLLHGDRDVVPDAGGLAHRLESLEAMVSASAEHAARSLAAIETLLADIDARLPAAGARRRKAG